MLALGFIYSSLIFFPQQQYAEWFFSHNLPNCDKMQNGFCSLMVGSHDRRSLQLFPKMYYYASPTLRSETTLPLKNHSTYVKNNHTM